MEKWKAPAPHRTVYMLMAPATEECATFMVGWTEDHDEAELEAAAWHGYVVTGTVIIDHRDTQARP